jgi:hypothetical protein
MQLIDGHARRELELETLLALMRDRLRDHVMQLQTICRLESVPFRLC